ncbi:MAG: YicC/YloC family endoribonuclease [Desulfurivibrionaceae bacterium]|nr:YicC family protein [Desulfobulbales bacterium]MDT8334310.1 YicC/YloC family endoribonuclease [Desulfurivibrionaceae bacterium]
MTRPLSMTSFGRGQHTANFRTWTVEIRSVNHRFCDIKIRLPRKYGGLEERIKKEIAAAYGRGHVEVNIGYRGEEEGAVLLKADLTLARQYLNCLVQLNDELGLNSAPDLAMIADYKEVISAEDREENLDQTWSEGIKPALAAALDECLEMRRTEGANLKKDLLDRLAIITAAAGKIEKMVPRLIEEKKISLEARLQEIIGGQELDQGRLAQEVAIMVDKADVTEELVRLNSHIGQFEKFLALDESAGRRLDFLLQEFLREINTLASKITNAEIAYLAVEVKNELEKMREQVQNLE